MCVKLALLYTNLLFFARLQYVKINIEGFENINFTTSLLTLKELLFILDCATKYSLHNPGNLFNLLIITLTGIVTWASFYMFRTSSH